MEPCLLLECSVLPVTESYPQADGDTPDHIEVHAGDPFVSSKGQPSFSKRAVAMDDLSWFLLRTEKPHCCIFCLHPLTGCHPSPLASLDHHCSPCPTWADWTCSDCHQEPKRLSCQLAQNCKDSRGSFNQLCSSGLYERHWDRDIPDRLG